MEIDIHFMKEQIPLFLDSALLTLKIACITIIISLLIASINGLILFFRIRILNKVIRAYVEVARNTPLLIQLFFLYFGLPSLGIKLSNFSIALLAMCFLGGGYMTEVIRSGLDSISKSQVESGYAIGLNKWQLFRFIILPQAATISAPALFANFIFLLKETSIISAIAVPELLYTTTNLISIYYKTSEMLIMLTASYIFLFVPLSFLLSWLERRNRYGQFGH
ncbi:amino acid ABC transporter permease [Bacillus cereus group sp. Sample30]|uniref:amino acid ABC transporter permease n=1 Tax=Bacillus cereus group sp. Sample30 TaxID=2816449 RepID=UPI002FDC41A9